MPPMEPKPTTYWGYIRVEELLSLQNGIEADDSKLTNDEVMFIVVHQIDELWFKLAIRELVSVRNLIAKNPVPEQSLASAVHGLRRLSMLFTQLASHFALMETMTTRDYLAFRDKLSPASGFQSAQLREIELLLGLDDAERISPSPEFDYRRALREPDGAESPASRRVAARLGDRPSLRDALAAWLHRTPIQGSHPGDPGDEDAVRGFIDSFIEAHRTGLARSQGHVLSAPQTETGMRDAVKARFVRELEATRSFLIADDAPEADQARVSRIRAALLFIESYRELPLLAWPRELIDALVAFEQSMIIFRQRHARMVERVIGRRTGTGGSAGVDYLDQTANKYRIFRDVWAVRTILLGAAALPAVLNAERYGFVAGT